MSGGLEILRAALRARNMHHLGGLARDVGKRDGLIKEAWKMTGEPEPADEPREQVSDVTITDIDSSA